MSPVCPANELLTLTGCVGGERWGQGAVCASENLCGSACPPVYVVNQASAYAPYVRVISRFPCFSLWSRNIYKTLKIVLKP